MGDEAGDEAEGTALVCGNGNEEGKGCVGEGPEGAAKVTPGCARAGGVARGPTRRGEFLLSAEGAVQGRQSSTHSPLPLPALRSTPLLGVRGRDTAAPVAARPT